MNYDLLVFDLDGTLIDSAPDLCIAVNRVLARYGGEPLDLPQIRGMIGDGAARLLARAFAARDLSIPDPGEVLREFAAAYAENLIGTTTLFEGVSATLDALNHSGIAMAVCTNKPEAPAREILQRLQVAGYFGEVVGGDTHPFRKPDARMLTALLGRFAVPPQRALMVGDSEIDAATAQAATVPFALMTYGYRRGPVAGIRCLAALDRFPQVASVAGLPETAAVQGLAVRPVQAARLD